jgi:AraC family transcriptional regulator, positive regulator of tynA and feaB
MSTGDAFKSDPALNHEMWATLLGSFCGLYRPEGIAVDTFAGSVRTEKIYGFDAIDLSGTAYRVQRTRRDVSVDGMDSYYATFQIAGQSTLLQNDRTANLAVGDVVLVDGTRPATWISERRRGRWFSFRLPRQSLITHMGFEPEGGLYAQGETAPARLLFRTVLDAVGERDALVAPAEPYMQLAIYDLLGAMFAATDTPSVSAHSDKLFGRVCTVIKDCFADPDIGPTEVAARVGISLRYLQKLFAARGSTFSGHVYSLRLDYAARLLQRRAFVKSSQPLSSIADASGFRDYAYFARSFRRRFGCSPSAVESKPGIPNQGFRPPQKHSAFR